MCFPAILEALRKGAPFFINLYGHCKFLKEESPDGPEIR